MAIHCIFETFIKRASFSLKIYDGSYSDYLFWANEMRLTFCVQADDDKPGNLRVVQRGVRIQNFEVRLSAIWLIFLDDSYLDRLKIDWRWRYSIFESGYVGSASLRDLFQRWNGLPSELPLILVLRCLRWLSMAQFMKVAVKVFESQSVYRLF